MEKLNSELLEALYYDKFRTEHQLHEAKKDTVFPADNGRTEAIWQEHIRGKEEKLQTIDRYLKLFLKPFLPLLILLFCLPAAAQHCKPSKWVPFAGGTAIFPRSLTGVGVEGGVYLRATQGLYLGLGVQGLYFERVQKGGSFQEVQAGGQFHLALIPWEDQGSPMVTIVPGYTTEGGSLYMGVGWAGDLLKVTVGRGVYQVRGQTVRGLMAQVNVLF